MKANKRTHRLRTCKLTSAIMVILSTGVFATQANASLVTFGDGDASYVRGSVVDVDGNGLAESIKSSVYFCKPSSFAGDEHYPDASLQSYGAERRGIVEIDLAPIRLISSNAADLVSAKIDFYFDGAIHEDKAPHNWVAQYFTTEVYTDSANGTIDGDDSGIGPDDFAGPSVANWSFSAGDTGPFTPDSQPEGPYAPGEAYAQQFGDSECQIFGNIWFEADFTTELAAALSDSTVSHFGFRWFSPETDVWTSMDGGAFLPTVAVNIVPEPTTAAFLFAIAGPVILLRKRSQ